MRRIFCVVIVLCVSACSFFTPDVQSFSIVHTNDLHSHLKPFKNKGEACLPEADSDCLGGFARIGGFVEQQRMKNPDLILLDAGDRFSGTIFYTLHKSRDISMLMNQMDYTAMTLGNHEFDDGNKELDLFVRSVSAPVVASNVRFPKESRLSKSVLPSITIIRGGRKIGIIGAVTEETVHSSSGGKEAVFLPVLPAIQAEIKKMQSNEVDVIILLTHTGIETDKQIAALVGGIDVIVGGHSHTLLSNGSFEDKEGGYPVVVYGPEAKPVLIVTAGKGGQYAGVLNFSVDKKGNITLFSGDTYRMDAGVPENAVIKKLVDGYSSEVKEIQDEIIFSSSGQIGMGKNNLCQEECLLGEVITDALYKEFAPVDIVLINSGSLRASLPKGKVSFGNLVEAYPFENKAVVVKRTGKQVRDMLEKGVEKYAQGKRVNAFLQPAGLSYAFSSSADIGQRVSDVMLLKQDGMAEPIQPAQTYTVLLNDFLAGGGDGFPVQEQVVSTGKSIKGSLIHSFTAEKNIKPVLKSRVREKK